MCCPFIWERPIRRKSSNFLLSFIFFIWYSITLVLYLLYTQFEAGDLDADPPQEYTDEPFVPKTHDEKRFLDEDGYLIPFEELDFKHNNKRQGLRRKVPRRIRRRKLPGSLLTFDLHDFHLLFCLQVPEIMIIRRLNRSWRREWSHPWIVSYCAQGLDPEISTASSERKVSKRRKRKNRLLQDSSIE